MAVSPDGKTMTVCAGTTSCGDKNQIRSKHPLPTTGDYSFTIQTGLQCGCFDAIALVLCKLSGRVRCCGRRDPARHRQFARALRVLRNLTRTTSWAAPRCWARGQSVPRRTPCATEHVSTTGGDSTSARGVPQCHTQLSRACLVNSYIQPGFIPSQSLMEFVYSPSSKTLSMRALCPNGEYTGAGGDKFRESRWPNRCYAVVAQQSEASLPH